MGRNAELVLLIGSIMMITCMVFAATCFRSIEALGRNPDQAPKIFIGYISAMAVAQFLAIGAILFMFQTYLPK